MVLRPIIACSIRPAIVSALSLGAVLLTAALPASAAEPVGRPRPYSGWGSGLIGVSLVQPVGPYQGFETRASRLNQVMPTRLVPVKPMAPTELPVPLEHIFRAS